MVNVLIRKIGEYTKNERDNIASLMNRMNASRRRSVEKKTKKKNTQDVVVFSVEIVN